MYILYGFANIYLPYSSSLKDKRKIIQSIIARIRKRFNISIAEVEFNDLRQRGKLGFAAVAASYGEAELFLTSIKEVLDLHLDDIEITDFDYKILS
jgi:uncharacterized protein YlxP (DUF503 family)